MKFKIEKTRAFWIYIVGGLLSMVVGAILLPVWGKTNLFFKNWGMHSVSVMISAVLLAYILLYLVKRIKRYSNTPAQIVAIVELVLMAVIAVVCFVSDFVPYNISLGGPCQIFAIALWVRGASGVYTGYYCDSEIVKEVEEEKKAKKNEKKNKKDSSTDEKEDEKAKKKKEIDTEKEPKGRVDDFTVWRLTLAIALITVGTYLFLKPAFDKIHLQWAFSCVIVVVGFFFVVLGFALKPRKVKVEKTGKRAEDDGKGNYSGDFDDSNDRLDKSEVAGALESGKVSIKLGSANAMTNTAAYDTVKEGNSLTVKKDK